MQLFHFVTLLLQCFLKGAHDFIFLDVQHFKSISVAILDSRQFIALLFFQLVDFSLELVFVFSQFSLLFRQIIFQLLKVFALLFLQILSLVVMNRDVRMRGTRIDDAVDSWGW